VEIVEYVCSSVAPVLHCSHARFGYSYFLIKLDHVYEQPPIHTTVKNLYLYIKFFSNKLCERTSIESHITLALFYLKTNKIMNLYYLYSFVVYVLNNYVRLTSYSSCETFHCNCKLVYYCIVFSYIFLNFCIMYIYPVTFIVTAEHNKYVCMCRRNKCIPVDWSHNRLVRKQMITDNYYSIEADLTKQLKYFSDLFQRRQNHAIIFHLLDKLCNPRSLL